MTVNLARLARMQALLGELAPLEAKLLPNEREVVRHVATKVADPGQTAFDDTHVLEVVLRNVRVREGFAMDATRTPPRVIDVKSAEKK
jgi:hypothetical protein